MKQFFRSSLLALPGFQALCRSLTRNHVRALMYHRFSPQDSVVPGHINQKTLHEHMRQVLANHTVITPDDHLQYISGQSRGGCPVVVTIDDGYLDCYENAFPVFKEHQIPAMLFATTGFVSADNWFWWDKLSWLIAQAPLRVWELDLLGTSHTLDLCSLTRKHRAWNSLADKCRFLKAEETRAILQDLSTAFGISVPDTAPESYAPCDWDHIREMAANGMLLGAHTVTHPILTRIDADEARFEICESKTRLETELKKPVSWFCYPQGGPADFDSTVRDIVAENYQGCYLAYQELQSPTDNFLVPRYHAPHEMKQLQWILCGAEYLILKLKSKLGLETGPGASYWSGSQTDKDGK